MSEKHPHLTAEYIRHVLDYDPLTGILVWRFRPEGPRKWNSKWAGKQAGTISPTGYRYLNLGKISPFGAHRIAWVHFHGEWPMGNLDHINGIRDDNRIVNLRLANYSQNGANKAMQRNNASGFIGVHFETQRGMWRARVNRNSRTYDVGFFNTPEEAHAAREEFLRKLKDAFTPNGMERPKYFHSRDAKR